MLSDNERNRFIRRMPKIELSYDRILHKKVYSELYMIIPKGPKAFMWFTYIEDKYVSIPMDSNALIIILFLKYIKETGDNSMAAKYYSK